MTETAATMPVPVKYLTTAKAAVYLGYKSPSAVRTLKMRGLLRPDGRRGRSGTDMYLITTLDRFLSEGAGTMAEGRPDAPGEGHSNDKLDGRLRADPVPGHIQNQDGLSRPRARDRSQDGHAEREEPGVREHHAGTGGGEASRDEERDSSRRAQRRASSRKVRRLRDILVRAKSRVGKTQVSQKPREVGRHAGSSPDSSVR